MNIIESYATNCGLKINKPYIFEKYFPIVSNSYITLHTTSKDAKTYDHWPEVVALLAPRLSLCGIDIVQVGAKNDIPLAGVNSLLGRTSIPQVAYLVRHAKLHLGIDSFPVHIAGAANVPLVALFSNSSPKNAGPYWGDKSKQILLEPDRSHRKPSYALQENPKTVNTITPEAIASAVCSLLDVPFDCETKTLLFGALYERRMVETVPNQVVALQSLGVPSIIVRMDFFFHEGFLEEQMKVGRVSIITDKAINVKLLTQYARHIDELFYFIKEDHDPAFIAAVSKLGIKHHLVTELSDEKINPIRFDYMDYGTIGANHVVRPTETLNIDLSTLFYKSNKFTLSDKKIYPSLAAYRANLPIPDFNCYLNPVIDTEEFWRESDRFYFLTR